MKKVLLCAWLLWQYYEQDGINPEWQQIVTYETKEACLKDRAMVSPGRTGHITQVFNDGPHRIYSQIECYPEGYTPTGRP